MKISRKTKMCLPLGAILLAVSLATLAAADRVWFKGTVEGQETDALQGNPPQQILVDGRLTGVASHLGRFTLTYKVTVSLPAGSSTGSAQLTGEDDDAIYTTIVGQSEPVPGSATLDRIVEINTITGGTGRFAGARGSFTVERLIDLTTGLTSGSLHGTITARDDAH